MNSAMCKMYKKYTRQDRRDDFVEGLSVHVHIVVTWSLMLNVVMILYTGVEEGNMNVVFPVVPRPV